MRLFLIIIIGFCFGILVNRMVRAFRDRASR